PFANSVILALALSGFDHEQFHFFGFLPKNNSELNSAVSEILKSRETALVMDTPYRLGKTLNLFSEVSEKLGIKKDVFLAMDLNKKEEELVMTNTNSLNQ